MTVNCVITLDNLNTDCIQIYITTTIICMSCAHDQSSSLSFHRTALIHRNIFFANSYFLLTILQHSGSTHKFYQSVPSQNTQRQAPDILEKLMLPKNLILARIKDLEFDCAGGKFHSPEDGYSLTVPKGTISEKLGSVSIQCGVIPYGPFGPFKYPDGIKPVSPIVWFCSTSSVNFQKPVEINIPHCLDCDSETDSQSLAFFKANHIVSDSSPGIFHFKEAEGVSSFPPNTSHGTLHSKHLCFYCIGSKDKEITNKANFCLITAKPVSFKKGSRIHFCLTYLLETCIQVRYPFCSLVHRPFGF